MHVVEAGKIRVKFFLTVILGRRKPLRTLSENMENCKSSVVPHSTNDIGWWTTNSILEDNRCYEKKSEKRGNVAIPEHIAPTL